MIRIARDLLVMGTAALALTACDSGSVPSPSERLEQGGAAIAEEVAADAIELRGDGLVAGVEAFYFSAGQVEVTTALMAILGDPLDSGRQEECGAGPIDYVNFDGGFSVNFQEGGLVGWFTRSASKNVQLAGEIQIGTPHDEAAAIEGFQAFEGSTLGEEFSLGSNVGGIIDDDAVAVLYAGTQCFFR
ncbi:MAG: aspartate-semialdehyde dehydrogenase [Erythrobacter sp.]